MLAQQRVPEEGFVPSRSSWWSYFQGKLRMEKLHILMLPSPVIFVVFNNIAKCDFS
jgi:hypothetical protein